MTTIAYKDGMMAGDTKINGGKIDTFAFMKKVIKIDGCLIGATGNIDIIQWFFKNFRGSWVTRNYVSTHSLNLNGKDDVFEALVVTPKKKIFLFEEKMFPVEVGTVGYIAIGSGADVATGALYMGASPLQAVAAAIRHDIYTGGRAQKISLGR